MIAFVGTSMANYIDIEKKEILLVIQDCEEYAINAAVEESIAIGHEFTEAEFEGSYADWYSLCDEVSGEGGYLLPPIFIRG